MKRILGLVTARGGSKGLPRKNVKTLAGKPLIAWTVEAAMQSTLLDRVIVSTDDEEISRISLENGAEVPFRRPAELAQDNSPHISVVLHALEWLEQQEGYRPDAVCLLQPTSPLNNINEIINYSVLQTHNNIKVSQSNITIYTNNLITMFGKRNA